MIAKLEWYEVGMAAEVGLRRRLEAIREEYENRHGMTNDDCWTSETEGACSEMVVAKYLKCYWGGTVNTLKSPDLGRRLQVRFAMKPHYRLIVRKGALDDEIFILVTGRAPVFDIMGWIKGVDAKQEKWWDSPNDREPAWFVPQRELHDITLLKRKTAADY